MFNAAQQKGEEIPRITHTGEVGQLLVREVVDRSEVGRLVLVGVMAEVLKRLLQIDFNFVEGLDGISPARDISAQVIFRSRVTRSLWGMGRTQFDGVSGGHDGWFTTFGTKLIGWWMLDL